MKILHVIPSYKPAYIYGGPTESVASLCEALVESNNEVSVYTTTANGKVELDVEVGKEVIVDTVSVIYFPRWTKGNTHVSPDLWTALYNHCREYDIVHIHSWWNTLVVVAAVICHYRKVPVVVSPRGMLSNYIMTKTHGTIKKWLHKLVGKKALQHSIFHATAESEYIECQQLIPNWKGFLLPNLINLPVKSFERTTNNVFTLLFMSRIHPKKGIEFLLEAMSQADFPIRLRIAGTGEETYINQLKEKAKTLQIEHAIDWLGWKGKDEKYIELAAADLFVLTSFNENFANVVIESLYVGTPVLVSDLVGLANFVVENELGWITKLNTLSIVSSIKEAIADKEKRELINETGRSKILEHFSRKALAKSYIQNYSHILADL